MRNVATNAVKLLKQKIYKHGKEVQKSKMAVWGGPTNSCEKERRKAKEKSKFISI